MSLERISTSPAMLGEGPCWDEKRQVLFWVDILGKKIRRYDPNSGEQSELELDEMIGTVAPCHDGRLLVALQRGFALVDPDGGALERLEEIEPDERTRFNDGKCDPQGRFWCGSMDLQEERPLGSLYRMDSAGTVSKVLDGLTISNGMGWSPDQRTMYHIDSPTRCVFAFDYDAASGQVANRRVVLQLDPDDGFPDGMTTDQEGMLWLSHWGAGRVCRWDPGSGKLLQRVDVPALNTSACCFGGPDLKDLYITTARKGLSAEQLEAFPGSGHLFRIHLAVAGSPTYVYRGAA